MRLIRYTYIVELINNLHVPDMDFANGFTVALIKVKAPVILFKVN